MQKSLVTAGGGGGQLRTGGGLGAFGGGGETDAGGDTSVAAGSGLGDEAAGATGAASLRQPAAESSKTIETRRRVTARAG